MHACYRMPDEPTRDLATALKTDLATAEQIEWLPPTLWRIHLLGLGNVTRGDALQVVDTLREKVGAFAPPTLHIAGVQPLIFDGDDAVWALLGGDAEDVTAVAKSMPRWVHPMGFVPDRRVYRPAVRLGRVTRETRLDYLEDLVMRLGERRGPDWDADEITVGRIRGEDLEVVGVVPLEGRLGDRHPLPPARQPTTAVPKQADGLEASRRLAVG